MMKMIIVLSVLAVGSIYTRKELKALVSLIQEKRYYSLQQLETIMRRKKPFYMD